jgi:hypothetical protein
MKQLKSVLFIALACLTGCTPKIKNDTSIGDAEAKTYQFLVNKITQDMKNRYGGNQYESEKITPVEIDDYVKIGIPNSTNYMFKKDNSKYVKGDLNHDKKYDLIICADMTEAHGPQTKKYFLFIQNKDGYQYFAECKADDIVAENCRKPRLNMGIFNLDSIAGGLLIGNTDYQGTDESNYLDYSYRCATEKYKLNVTEKILELVYRSDLMKKNKNTGKYEKVEITK